MRALAVLPLLLWTLVIVNSIQDVNIAILALMVLLGNKAHMRAAI